MRMQASSVSWKQKTELENTDYEAVARSYKLTPQQLADF